MDGLKLRKKEIKSKVTIGIAKKIWIAAKAKNLSIKAIRNIKGINLKIRKVN